MTRFAPPAARPVAIVTGLVLGLCVSAEAAGFLPGGQAAETPAAATPVPEKPAIGDPLVGRAWVEEKPVSGLPGVMLAFMADGALLMDSCWETYTLRPWTRTGPDAIAWDEDGAKITATVVSVTPTQLTLKVKAGNDTVEHRYTAGKAPYLCPEMKR